MKKNIYIDRNIYLQNTHKKFFCLIVCLKSINPHILNKLYQIDTNNLSNVLGAYLNNQEQQLDRESILKLIYIIHEVVKEKATQQIIINILQDYLYNYTNVNNSNNYTEKYLTKFVYKYKKNLCLFQERFYFFLLAQNKNIIDKFYENAIINLYILYQTSLQEGPFTLLKYIYCIN